MRSWSASKTLPSTSPRRHGRARPSPAAAPGSLSPGDLYPNLAQVRLLKERFLSRTHCVEGMTFGEDGAYLARFDIAYQIRENALILSGAAEECQVFDVLARQTHEHEARVTDAARVAKVGFQ